MAAMAVQSLLPFLLAADIQAVDRGAVPICGADFGSRSGPSGGDHRPGGIGGCPICVALHANLAFAKPLPPVLPAPSPAQSIVETGAQQAAPEFALALCYRSRAPPAV
jgi:hypothetical protein